MMEETTPSAPAKNSNETNLITYLQVKLPQNVEEIKISQFPGGSSNLTYSVSINGQDLVLRRPPFGNRVKSAHDMLREFNVLSKLTKFTNPHQNRCFTAMNPSSDRRFI
ncbi:MAG: hypothetical protein R2681_01810 [Pyrinomonadaceae bacterium]